VINRLFEILDAQWLIHRESALAYLPVLISFLNGGKISLESDDTKKPHVFAMENASFNLVNRYELDNPDIQPNAIAVIPIQGTIVSWKSIELLSYLQKAEAHPNIIAIVFLVNSPGGMAYYTDITADAIKASSKPTVSVIMNMAASAAMWLISATNYRIASSPMDRVGSIGTKSSYTDFNGFLKEKLGITVYDIYASKSTRKDEEIRALLQDEDRTKILQSTDFVNEIFHQAIRENLGLKEDSEVFTGAVYHAKQAIEMGLINEINTLSYAFEYAYKLGLSNRIKQFNL
jgi:ClpP class serine protease